jgi:hypothetical protein
VAVSPAEPEPAEPEPEDGPTPPHSDPTPRSDPTPQSEELSGKTFDRGATAPEALAAGFTHRDPDPRGAGFTAGGAADPMVPGVSLAGLTDQAWAAGLDLLDNDELADVLCAWRRLSSWAAAGEAAAVTEFARRRTAAGPPWAVGRRAR